MVIQIPGLCTCSIQKYIPITIMLDSTNWNVNPDTSNSVIIKIQCFEKYIKLLAVKVQANFEIKRLPILRVIQILIPKDTTVYPKKYAHGFCFAVLCCGYTLTDFPISIRLTSLALWQSNDCPSASKTNLMNMNKYLMWIHYERLHNHNKAKHNKTVCIFLGIYCKCGGIISLKLSIGSDILLLW